MMWAMAEADGGMKEEEMAALKRAHHVRRLASALLQIWSHTSRRHLTASAACLLSNVRDMGTYSEVQGAYSCSMQDHIRLLPLMQDLLQEELHEDDLQQIKQSAQGLGVQVRLRP
jgi:hypothetical protein